MPPRTQNPDSSINMHDIKPSVKRKRRPSDLNIALIEMFARMHNSSLLGAAANEWQRAVERVPELANNIYTLKLAKVVEVALVSTLSDLP